MLCAYCSTSLKKNLRLNWIDMMTFLNDDYIIKTDYKVRVENKFNEQGEKYQKQNC